MNLDHVFIELGLSEDNPELAAVTGMAVVRTDRKGKVLAAYSDTAKHDGPVAPIDRLYERVRAEVLKPYPASYVVVSQHAATYKRILGDRCFPERPWVDIAQLAWPLGYCDMISARDLDTLSKHFAVSGGEYGTDGTMTGNCEILVRVYWAMMQRYRTALLGEEAVRDIGGEALASLRKFVGF
jgi:hypothetical protein